MTLDNRMNLGLTDVSGARRAPASESAVSTSVLVDGMTCAHCVASVTEEISAIDGVEAVDIALNAGGSSRVSVHSSAPIDSASIRAAVEEAGYALAGTPE
jgi:copper chaperone CopZ